MSKEFVLEKCCSRITMKIDGKKILTTSRPTGYGRESDDNWMPSVFFIDYSRPTLHYKLTNQQIIEKLYYTGNVQLMILRTDAFGKETGGIIAAIYYDPTTKLYNYVLNDYYTTTNIFDLTRDEVEQFIMLFGTGEIKTEEN